MRCGVFGLVLLTGCNFILSGQPKPFLPHLPEMTEGSSLSTGEASSLMDDLNSLLKGQSLEESKVGLGLVHQGEILSRGCLCSEGEESRFSIQALWPLFQSYTQVVRDRQSISLVNAAEIQEAVFGKLGVHRPGWGEVSLPELIPWAQRISSTDNVDGWGENPQQRFVAYSHWKKFPTVRGELFWFRGEDAAFQVRVMVLPKTHSAAVLFVPQALKGLLKEILQKVARFVAGEPIYFPA